MQRRQFVKQLTSVGLLSSFPIGMSSVLASDSQNAISVETLPKLKGELTLYLGRGEGGLYEDVINAIKKRNPEFQLNIRRGPTAALANAIVAESKAGIHKVDLFWAVDSGAIGLINRLGLAKKLPQSISQQLKPAFRYESWIPVTGRLRTLPFNPERIESTRIPKDIMALADGNIKVGWAPAYSSFQSFVTAMRLLEGDNRTAEWLKGVSKNAKRYAGELGVVMAVERGEVDVGFANHYYTLRLKSGKPDAKLSLAFTNNDAGCLVNASGIVALKQSELANNFIRYLLTQEVQSYLATQAYEIPLVAGVAAPEGLPNIETLSPPKVDLADLADIQPTLKLMRKAGVL